jgi:hypothetical protein
MTGLNDPMSVINGSLPDAFSKRASRFHPTETRFYVLTNVPGIALNPPN